MRRTVCTRCPNLTPCAVHPRSTRRARIGAAWRQLRALIIERDPLCRDVSGCTAPTTDVDHIVARERGGTDALDNLVGLCHRHHSAKTARQDGAFGFGVHA